MVLKTEIRRRLIELVQEVGADYAERVFLREKGDCVQPGGQVYHVLLPPVADLPAPPLGGEQTCGLVLLQLLADGGLVQREPRVKLGEVTAGQPLHDLPQRQQLSVRKDIQQVKMEGDVLGGKALGFERLVEGVAPEPAAVHGQEHALAVGVLTETHVVPQPALHPAAFVVIAAGAFRAVFLPALEAINVELAHVAANSLVVFYQLAVCHPAPPPVLHGSNCLDACIIAYETRCCYSDWAAFRSSALQKSASAASCCPSSAYASPRIL